MSVKIRLRRTGRKKQPSYRVVVTDSRAPRDGAYLEIVGFYNPRRRPAELRLDLERFDAWVGKGAGMTDTVASLVRKARRGGDSKVELKPMGPEAPRVVEAVQAPASTGKPARPGSRGKRKEAEAAAPKAAAEADASAEPDSPDTEPAGE